MWLKNTAPWLHRLVTVQTDHKYDAGPWWCLTTSLLPSGQYSVPQTVILYLLLDTQACNIPSFLLTLSGSHCFRFIYSLRNHSNKTHSFSHFCIRLPTYASSFILFLWRRSSSATLLKSAPRAHHSICFIFLHLLIVSGHTVHLEGNIHEDINFIFFL